MTNLSSQHHSFDIALAEKYGMEEAILIHHFQHWIRHNKAMKRNFIEGRTWSYQSLEDIAAHFPYLNQSKVFEIIERLCTGKSRRSTKQNLDFQPVLMKGNYNKNPYDRTTWYAFVDESQWILANAKMENGDCQKEDWQMPTPIPHTKTHTKTDEEKEGAKPPPPAPPVNAVASLSNPPSKKEIPKEAQEAAQKLLDKIIAHLPNKKTPNMKNWGHEILLLHRRDKRSWEEINEMIEWLSENDFWAKIIQSPSGLRRNWIK